MTPERFEIAKLVVLGKLDPDYITLEETIEIQEYVTELILDRMSEDNPAVFYGVEKGLPN